jgi:ATP-binding cassette, subfamily B, bacterial
LESVPDREFVRRLGSLKPAVRFVLPYRTRIAGAAVALLLTAGVTLSLGQGLRLVVDEGFGAGNPALLMQSLVAFAGLVVLLTIGTYVRYYLVSWVGERVSADIRRAVFERLLTLHPGYFEANLPTEIQSRITTDTTLLQTVLGSSVSVALRNALMFVGGLVLLVVSNPKLALVVLVGAPVVVAFVLMIGRRVRDLSRRSQDTLARVGSYAGEALRQIKVVQAFNHERRDIATFGAHVESAFDAAVARIRQRALLVAVVMLLVLAAIAVMLWLGGQDVLAGRTTPGELAAFIFYAFIVAGSVGAISEVYGDLQRAAGATERLVELLEAESELPEPALPRTLPPREARTLAFDRVGFRYPSRPDVRVLTDLTLSVAAGETLALVGPSGAGKTTLFDLALRFYDPERGRVLLGNIDLRELSLASVRAEIGLVPQHPVLFAGTLRDNLRYGNPDADDDALWRALRAANADAFVQALPDGLDTPIGEEGSGLSGGQRQRLAIARALVKGPKLLLMDEATSALDAASEEMIRQTVRGLKGRCTILIIAHRLSTVVEADRIAVLDGGRLIAEGNHDALMATSPLYREFAEIQFTAPAREEAARAAR